jgi:hypothetical protein
MERGTAKNELAEGSFQVLAKSSQFVMRCINRVSRPELRLSRG